MQELKHKKSRPLFLKMKRCKFKIFLVCLIVVFTITAAGQQKNYIFLTGLAQGTTYHITYKSDKNINYHVAIDSLLSDFDNSLSIYNPNSIISRINRNDSTVKTDEHFKTAFLKSQEVSEQTGGAFDITVSPLVNAWGFGFSKQSQINSHLIDSLLRLVGYQKIKLENDRVVKADSRMMIDMNAIAQGYAVDLTALFLESKGIKHYLVEIGGEIRTKGKNARGKTWTVGIDKPTDQNEIPGRDLQSVLALKDKSISTSGNYRAFYKKDGKKYGHIIDPRTGYPVQHNVLSATVISEDCITADAYATVFIVTGLEKAKEILKKHPGLDAYLIYTNEKGGYEVYCTDRIREMLQ